MSSSKKPEFEIIATECDKWIKSNIEELLNDGDIRLSLSKAFYAGWKAKRDTLIEIDEETERRDADRE